MPQYMLLMYHPVEEDAGWRRTAQSEGGESDPSPEQMAGQQQRWAAFVEDLKQSGHYVANSGLQGADAATTVRVRDGETVITDGPFAETKEMLAGYFLIDAPDLDVALTYAARVPSATWGSVEVRPVWG